MGQIIGSAAKPKRCNISKLSQLGTPAAGEYILVSSDNSMNAAGQGIFDCYIVGDGTTAATALSLHYDKTLIVKEQSYTIGASSIDNNGIKVSQGGYTMTDWVNIENVSTIHVFGYVASTRAPLAFYSAQSEDSFLSIVDKHYTVNEYITSANFPPNAKYVRACTRQSDNHGLVLFTEVADLAQINASKINELDEQQRIGCFFEGEGNTLVRQEIYNLIPNKTYKLVMKSATWQLPSAFVEGSGSIIGVSNFLNGTETTFYTIRYASQLKSEYVFTVPQDSDYISIFGRADYGVKVYYRLESVEQDAAKIVLRNGGIGNPSNAKKITTEIVPTYGHNRVMLNISRPPSSGYIYSIGYALTSSYNDIGTTAAKSTWEGYIIHVDALESNTLPMPVDLTDYPNAVGICFEVWEVVKNGSSQNTLRVDDFDDYPMTLNYQDFADGGVQSVYGRNIEKEVRLDAMCRLNRYEGGSPYKDFQVAISTDSHEDAVADANVISAVNDFGSIDAYVNCGDIMSSFLQPAPVAAFKTRFANLEKQGYIVIGNHDCGNSKVIPICGSHKDMYDCFIKPMVDAGFLASGEYTANLPYWYHDDATYKIRLIGLYEYDSPLDIDETYWRAIAYDSSLPNITGNTTYAVGDKVNAKKFGVYGWDGYTDYSFECVQACTTPSSPTAAGGVAPSYKVMRGTRVIRETQANWFVSTLLSTPANYGVIVIMHNPFSLAATTQNMKFSYPSGVVGSRWTQNLMQNDMIRDILVAFKNGASYSDNIVMTGDAAYMNTQGGGTYCYQLSANFANKNTGVHLLGVLGGHSHRDLVFKDATEDIYQVTPVCTATDKANAAEADIRRSTTDGIAKDSITCVSFYEGRIALAKLGVDVTDRGAARDYEVIELSE